MFDSNTICGISVEGGSSFWLIKTSSQTEQASFKAYNFLDVDDDIYINRSLGADLDLLTFNLKY